MSFSSSPPCRYLECEGEFILFSRRSIGSALERYPSLQDGVWCPEPSGKYFGKLDSTGIMARGLGTGSFSTAHDRTRTLLTQGPAHGLCAEASQCPENLPLKGLRGCAFRQESSRSSFTPCRYTRSFFIFGTLVSFFLPMEPPSCIHQHPPQSPSPSLPPFFLKAFLSLYQHLLCPARGRPSHIDEPWARFICSPALVSSSIKWAGNNRTPSPSSSIRMNRKWVGNLKARCAEGSGTFVTPLCSPL